MSERIGIPDADLRVRENAIKALERLYTNEAVGKIIEKWRKHGVKDKDIFWLLDYLPAILGEWEIISKESLKQIKRRHSKIAKMMRKVAKELGKDEKYGHVSICDGTILRLTYMRIPETEDLIKRGLLHPYAAGFVKIGYNKPMPQPSLRNYMEGFADHLESDQIIPGWEEEFYNQLPYKKNQKTFTIKKVHELISVMLEMNGVMLRQYNVDIATLSNIILDLRDDDCIKPNDCTQALKKTRRKYYKE